ncbi:DUF3592 domain-containing protein [Shewanella zhangzhouensis]|uniref:DUF3592 domain-containing protein n=1 Tax=Shewanella zhangzhouensis TaxID=2864213 RepID=UPI001C65DA18|nr:DUF3592 domain-containing protein [Shewanella zhangzhouensis]QYK03432.1 DUF3592 domain-containing protein [Shewanella zhangzhouensis]
MNLMLLFIGSVFLLLGVCMLCDYFWYLYKAEKIQGRITRVDEYQRKDRDSRVRTLYRPYFEFSMHNVRYEIKSNTSYYRKIMEEGEQVDILFIPGHEDKARLARANNPVMACLFIVLGLPALYLGVAS